MLSQPPEQLPALLFVDDEVKTCRHFTRLFSSKFRILIAHDGIEAMEVFREQHEDIGIIMTDQRMPNGSGTEFLQKAAALKPSVKRILSTAYANVDSAIEAVNSGGIYRYITKPWEVSELEVTLMRAMELYLVETERESLRSQTSSNVETIAAVERIHSLAALSVFKESSLRNVSGAISVLTELGQAKFDQLGQSQKWEEAYQNHRQFIQLAHAALPDNLADRPALDPNQLVPVSELITLTTQHLPDLPANTSPGDSAQRLPGPLQNLGSLYINLAQSLLSVCGQSDGTGLHETNDGLELRLPAPPVKKALQPIFESGETNIQESQACLDLLKWLLIWHHQGGTLQVNYDQDQQSLRLLAGYSKPASQNDPWQNLALDLVANDSFWQRQL